MDGENNGKPYEQMDDLGVSPPFLEIPMWIKCLKLHSQDPDLAHINILSVRWWSSKLLLKFLASTHRITAICKYL